MAIHDALTARNFYLADFCSSGPFICSFFPPQKNSPVFCLFVVVVVIVFSLSCVSCG